MDSDHKKEILEKLVKCDDIDNPAFHFNHLRELGDNLIESPNFDDLAKFLNALGNKKRLIILSVLKKKDRCVCELEALLDESQPSVSHHLKILENAGLIRGWKKGKFTHYDLVEKKIQSYLDQLNQKII
ncbi:MAG: ArsR/SmtB family transcription factor [Promethearchaeota archaeon]|jgi:ArsR family transcriptional regulator